MNIVFAVVSHSHPIDVLGAVFEAFLCFHVCHLFVSNPDNFTSNVVSCMGCFTGNFCTVSSVILPAFKKKSINNDPARVVGVLADNIKERIRGGTFSKTGYHLPLRWWESWKVQTSGALEGSSGKESS